LKKARIAASQELYMRRNVFAMRVKPGCGKEYKMDANPDESPVCDSLIELIEIHMD
jgi:hypothetical protein